MKRVKKVVVYILTLCVILSCYTPSKVCAEEYTPIDTRNPNEAEGTTEADLERVHAMEIQSNTWESWPEGPVTNGEAAIVMDASNGAILYAKNIDGYAYPASITKILTTLVALENADLTDTVTATADSINSLESGYANIGFKIGEEVSMEDALYAVLLASANEVSHAVGSSVGEGYEWFIEKMNSRAKELGAVNSHFVNTNGMHDDDHYTTAKDMALITQELLNNHPEFEKIAQTIQYTIGKTNLTEESRTFQQVHKMFYESSEYFDSRVIAGKTGYTIPARNTLVTCTDDGNLKLITVVLKTYGRNVYTDTEALINYGYDNFEKLAIDSSSLSTEIQEKITAVTEDSYVTVPKGVTLEDLEVEFADNNDGTGILSYTYKGSSVGTVDVSVPMKIAENPVEKEKEEEKSEGFGIVKIIAIVFIVLALSFVVFLVILLVYREKKRAERRRRKEMRRQRYLREQEMQMRQEARRKEQRNKSRNTRIK